MVLGLKNIDDLDTDTSYRAQQIRILFGDCKRLILEEYDWAFASTRAQLLRLPATPISGWAYFYELPTDLIRIHQVRASENDFDVSYTRRDKSCIDIAYELSQPRLLTDAEEVWMLYTRGLLNLENWPRSVAEALSYRLAMDMATILTESASKRQEMERLYERSIIKARTINTANDAVDRPRAVGWLAARYGSSGTW